MDWEDIKKKINKVNINNENRTQLIALTREYLVRNPNHEDASVSLVFLLYHGVVDTVEKEKGDQMIDVPTKYPMLYKHLKEAINIAQKIIDKDPKGETRNGRNTRMYLAQIYSMLNDPKGKKLSEENFELHPNSWYAERAGTNLLYFKEYDRAIEWFKKSVKLSEKEREHKYPGLLQIAHTYYILGDTESAQKYSKEALKTLEEEEQNKQVKQAIKDGFLKMIKNYNR